MRKFISRIAVLLLVCMSACAPSCSGGEPLLEPPQPVVPDGNDAENNNENNNNNNNDTIAMADKINIIIKNRNFTVTLADNETAKAFKAMLPMTVAMDELNGNEKYHYLTTGLPANASRPVTIQAGDLMLYGTSCVVLFYKTFTTSYSYTRIGKIDNPSSLSDAVGAGDVEVTFATEN